MDKQRVGKITKHSRHKGDVLGSEDMQQNSPGAANNEEPQAKHERQLIPVARRQDRKRTQLNIDNLITKSSSQIRNQEKKSHEPKPHTSLSTSTNEHRAAGYSTGNQEETVTMKPDQRARRTGSREETVKMKPDQRARDTGSREETVKMKPDQRARDTGSREETIKMKPDQRARDTGSREETVKMKPDQRARDTGSREETVKMKPDQRARDTGSREETVKMKPDQRARDTGSREETVKMKPDQRARDTGSREETVKMKPDQRARDTGSREETVKMKPDQRARDTGSREETVKMKPDHRARNDLNYPEKGKLTKQNSQTNAEQEQQRENVHKEHSHEKVTTKEVKQNTENEDRQTESLRKRSHYVQPEKESRQTTGHENTQVQKAKRPTKDRVNLIDDGKSSETKARAQETKIQGRNEERKAKIAQKSKSEKASIIQKDKRRRPRVQLEPITEATLEMDTDQSSDAEEKSIDIKKNEYKEEKSRDAKKNENKEEKSRDTKKNENKEEKSRDTKKNEYKEEKSRDAKKNEYKEEKPRGSKRNEYQEEKSRDTKKNENKEEKSRDTKKNEYQEEKSRGSKKNEYQEEKSRDTKKDENKDTPTLETQHKPGRKERTGVGTEIKSDEKKESSKKTGDVRKDTKEPKIHERHKDKESKSPERRKGGKENKSERKPERNDQARHKSEATPKKSMKPDNDNIEKQSITPTEDFKKKLEETLSGKSSKKEQAVSNITNNTVETPKGNNERSKKSPKKPKVSKHNINKKDSSKEYVDRDKMSEVENGNLVIPMDDANKIDDGPPQIRLYVKNETVKSSHRKSKLLEKKNAKKKASSKDASKRRKSSGGTSDSDIEHNVPMIVVHTVGESTTDKDEAESKDDKKGDRKLSAGSLESPSDRKLSNGSVASHPSETSTSRRSSLLSDLDMEDDPDFEAQMMEEMKTRKQGKHGRRRRRLSTAGSSTPGSSRRPSVNEGEDDASTSAEDERRQIIENIQIQKEIMADLRNQFWPMKKKLKALKFAKNYIEKYEGSLSRSKGYQEAGAKYLKTIKRAMVNFLTFFILWEMKIKRIESYFGTVIASYFTFLRWVFWMNLLLASLCVGFIVVPEMMAGASFGTTKSKTIPPDQTENAMNLKTLFDFGGYLQYSLTFYGYYGSDPTLGAGYRLPLAYFLTGVATFLASFIVVLKTMARIAKQTQAAGSESDQYQFNMLLFTGWDFMIGNAETAKNKQAEIITMFKEYIVEEQEKAKDEKSKLLIFKRIVANIGCSLTLAASSYAVFLVVERSVEFEKFVKNGGELSWWESNEVTMVTSLMTSLLPNVFDLFGLLEEYHPKQELRWQLARILALNLINLYTLVFALYQKVVTKNKAIQAALQVSQTFTLCQQLANNSSATFSTYNFSSTSTVPASYTVPHANCTPPSSDDLDICWETEIGQEFAKLTVFDLITTLGIMLIIDFFRGLVVRFCNCCFCWDLETKFPEYGDFKLAENILHLINNQQMIWMGTFFSPLLPAMNQVKLLILMYARGWALTVCNVPPERVFKASRSNNFYYFILIAMLYLSAVAILFMVVNLRPSLSCGPFREVSRSYFVVTDYIETEWPSWVNTFLQNAASPAVIIPIFMAMAILIYYLRALTVSLQRANKDLIRQLEYERTEEKKKVYAMADAKSSEKTGETEQVSSMRSLLEKKGFMKSILDQGSSNTSKSNILRNVFSDVLSAKQANTVSTISK